MDGGWIDNRWVGGGGEGGGKEMSGWVGGGGMDERTGTVTHNQVHKEHTEPCLDTVLHRDHHSHTHQVHGLSLSLFPFSFQ